MTHDCSGKVSLWIFRQKQDSADAGKDILKELAGVESYDLDFQDIVIGDSPRPLRELMGQLSCSDSFIDEAITTALRRQIDVGYGVVAQYDFIYVPNDVAKPIEHDPEFLGSFSWHE
jgi:hypothetical protein